MEKINWKKDWKTIPNLMSIFRLILIPLYLYLVLTANSLTDFYRAGAVIALSGITDFLDGFIARKYNQITELGKVLDPVSDKITQVALVASMAYYHPVLWLLLGLLIVKEGFMLIAGWVALRKNIKLDGAKWYGKIATAVIYFGMTILLLFPSISTLWENIIFILITYCLLQSFLLYFLEYRKMFKQLKK